MPFFLLRLEVLWGQGPSFLLPLDPVGMGRILHGRTNSVSCRSFLVLFLPSFIAVPLWNLNYVLTCTLQPFPGKMDYISSHSVLSTPPGWQRGIKGELWSFLEGSIIANFFSYIGTAFISLPLSPWTDVLLGIVGYAFVLKILRHYWKRRGVGGRKPIIDSNIYLIWQNLRETCWDKAGHFFDLPDFLSWKATGVTARYVNYKLDFICAHLFSDVSDVYILLS